MYIDEQLRLTLNGARQYISIRSNKQGAPLLLYLHGGPGDAALPLVLKFNKALEEQFTVVVLEQRGAGKSYYKFLPDEKINIDTFIQDIYELTTYLLERFNQQKLYLVGHSWGSVLGLKFIERYPELVHTYIGCGQVTNMKKSSKASYDFVIEKADYELKQKLKKIDCSYTGENWLHNLLFVTRLVVKFKGSLYGQANYNKLTLPFFFSRHYSLIDLIKRQLGSLQSIKRLWPELMEVDFFGVTEYSVPVIFAEGSFDMHVSSKFTKMYYDSITSQKQFYWFTHSCHFPQWSENERFNKLLIDLL